MPAVIVDEINESYLDLDDNHALAVRSSANAEDLPDLSFAGQQETYLNVTCAIAVIEAVKKCWTSLWTERVLAYRHQNGVEQDAVAMAVVAQIMVPSDVSGILFTANPATGDRSEIILNASFGLGEAVVGGHVTPDTYIVDRESLTATETIIGPKALQIISDGKQGTRIEDIPESERDKSSLTGNMIKELTKTALEIETLYEGLPQDIEWSVTNDKLWLLQSRPITNLPPQPIDVVWEPRPPAKILYRRQIVENIPDPVCPLFDELYLTVGLENARGGVSLMVGGGPIYMSLHGFAYQRADWNMLQIRSNRKLSEDELEAAEMNADEQHRQWMRTNSAMEQHDMELFLDSLSARDRREFDAWAKSAAIENLAHELTISWRDKPDFVAFDKTQVNEKVLNKWQEETMPGLLAAINEWRKVDPKTAKTETLLTGIHELAIAEGDYWSNDTGHTFGVAKATDNQLQTFLKENLPEHHFTSGQFLSGFKARTMQANDAMYEISKLIQNNDSLWELVVVTPAARVLNELKKHPDSTQVLKAINAFMDEYGHQGYTLDFVEPSQSEDPTPFFANLKTMVADREYSPKKHEVDATQKREQALSEIEDLLDGLQYWRIRFRLWFTHQFYWVREESMFYLGTAWPVLRSLAAELGRRLVDIGTFSQADDVYYCVTAELEKAIEALNAGKPLPDYAQLAGERR